MFAHDSSRTEMVLNFYHKQYYLMTEIKVKKNRVEEVQNSLFTASQEHLCRLETRSFGTATTKAAE